MCAVPNMAIFCTFFISCLHSMLLRYYLNDFEMVPLLLVSLLLSHFTCPEFLLFLLLLLLLLLLLYVLSMYRSLDNFADVRKTIGIL